MRNSKSLKKVLAFALTLCVLVVSVTVGSGNKTVYAATNEVSVIDSDSFVWSHAAGHTLFGVTINIKVKNIAYEKKVTIHGKNDITGEWYDVDAKFSHMLDNGYEVWTAYPVAYSRDFEYCVKYEVAGQTYWDNNNGQNYIASYKPY